MVEAVGQFIDELTTADVNAVHDGVLLTAQDAVGLTAGLQHLRVCVFLHHQLDLLEQCIQVLERTNLDYQLMVNEIQACIEIQREKQLTFSILPAL